MTTLKLTPEMMMILNDAIQNMPYKVAAPFINEINKQIAADVKTEMGTTPPYDDHCS